jgi:ATP-dependent RNA helicase DeaD
VAELLHEDHYQSDALHGDLSQDQRDRVMKSFRQRQIKILVATDVASRGIDVTDITHVVNFDLPDDYDVYTHRSGRTGRAGKEGISIVLANLREHYKIRILEGIVKKKFEHKKVPTSKEVCDSKLKIILDKMVNMETADKELAPYLPSIITAFENLSREDLVKRLMTPEFGELVKAYKNTPDLNVQSHQPNSFDKRNNGRTQPRERDRDSDRSRERVREAAPSHIHVSPDTAMAMVHINLGRKDTVTPPILIQLINRATHGPKLLLGRIKISDNYTDFEVAVTGAKKLVRNLCGVSYQNKEVAASMVASVDTAQSAPSPRHSTHARPDFPKRDRRYK